MKNSLNTGRTSQTANLMLAGLFAALTAICSWININLPFTPVPINLALIGPYMAGILLGFKYGILSQIVYILMGILGIPVFAGFTSGAGVLVGPTGGFIIGYILCAMICGLPIRTKTTSTRIFLMVSGLFACYACGLLWFIIITGSTISAGLTACVIPFLPGDAMKIALTSILVKYLSKVSIPT